MICLNIVNVVISCVMVNPSVIIVNNLTGMGLLEPRKKEIYV